MSPRNLDSGYSSILKVLLLEFDICMAHWDIVIDVSCVFRFRLYFVMCIFFEASRWIEIKTYMRMIQFYIYEIRLYHM